MSKIAKNGHFGEIPKKGGFRGIGKIGHFWSILGGMANTFLKRLYLANQSKNTPKHTYIFFTYFNQFLNN